MKEDNQAFYMREALKLAEKGRGKTSPNPIVGAVIVKNGEIIGKGYHEKYGEPHAERNALANCTQSPEGADLYVTLEPCCHYGKTPPCTEAILEHKIARVFVGALDPNPLVAGKGIDLLQKHGVKVETGICKEECEESNCIFFHYIQTKTPFVVMKYAMTADGKIATYTGDSKWITGEAARNRVHMTRNALSGIMVGIGTVLADNPLLTCRIPGGRNPIRIICDSQLRIPLDSEIIKTAHEVPTIIAAAKREEEKEKALQEAGAKILFVPNKEKKVDLPALMNALGQEGMDSILLEGGSTLHYSALEAGIVQRVEAYIAPKLFGGFCAKTPIGGLGVEKAADSWKLHLMKVSQIEEDILAQYCVKKEGV